MLAQQYSDTATIEKIESIIYEPSVQDSGDLESGTSAITATAEESGLGNANYNEALALPIPEDGRLVIQRLCTRLQVEIDSMTAAHLCCRVYVDAQDANHRLFDADWLSAGTQTESQEVSKVTLPAVFDLLNSGDPHTFYFYFWVDTGNAVISKVELWEGVGRKGIGTPGAIMKIAHEGWLSVSSAVRRMGTGTPSMAISQNDVQWYNFTAVGGHDANLRLPSLLAKNPQFLISGSVATDLCYLHYLIVNLRSMK